ncbi:exonuclease domain-containing protein [Sphingomonas sp. Leaf17]|uniref:exonuclease domain-containing protein n=1 Tax=Sphingomonas sp. Leaf17 TaxID=1735683 RepID=UPI000A8C007D|nr:exonuclease domain-containing protein [Sphingomonas sp. Leaf17]
MSVAPDFVVIDVETACSRVSSICQVGIVGFRDGQEVFAYESLVDPLDTFNPFNTRIHGIEANHVVGQPTFADVYGVIHGHLTNRTTVAHSHFDKGALAAACRLHGLPPIETRWLDSVRVAQRTWPDLPSHKLGELAKYLGIAHRHHDALSDARAAGWVIVRAIAHSGLTLADWLAPLRPPGPAPRPAPEGPLSGQRIAILGQPRDGPLAHRLAAAGGRVMTAISAGTTILVVSGGDPIGPAARNSAAFVKADRVRRRGGAIRILSEQALIAAFDLR